MSFTGNPGTGKTTVALRMAEILHRLGYVRKGHVVAVTRDDLVGQYIGHTAPKTKEVLKRAMGGVLFIDEAYYLYRPENERDYGQEAIEILLQVMENQRDDLVVILAGYKDRMDTFFAVQPRHGSRIAHHVEFPDYTDDELLQIAEKMLGSENYRFGDGRAAAFARVPRAPHAASRTSPTRAACATRWTAPGCAQALAAVRRARPRPDRRRPAPPSRRPDIRASRVFEPPALPTMTRARTPCRSRTGDADAVPDRAAPHASRGDRRRSTRCSSTSRCACKAIARAWRRHGRAGAAVAAAQSHGRSTSRAKSRRGSTSSPTRSSSARPSGAGAWRAWRPRRWTSRTRSRPSTRAASTCWSSTRSTARATSTSTSRSARIFSILRAPRAGTSAPRSTDFLQPGHEQVAAGYAIYGPSTMLVLTVGSGVARLHARSRARRVHPDAPGHPRSRGHQRIRDQHAATAASGSRRSSATSTSAWPARPGRAARTSTCAGSPRMVAEAHRILMRGGVFLYPRDTKDPCKPGRLRLLYEANPIGIADRAGGRACLHRARADSRRAAGVAAPAHRR